MPRYPGGFSYFSSISNGRGIIYARGTIHKESVVRSSIDMCLGCLEDFPTSLQFATAEG